MLLLRTRLKAPEAKQLANWTIMHRIGLKTASPESFEKIPGSRGVPFLGTLPEACLEGALSGSLHKYIHMRYQQFGPIFRENLGGIRAVFVHDPDDIRELLKNEGKYPERIEFIPWKLHRQLANRSLGLLLQ